MSNDNRKDSLIYLFNEVDADGNGYFTREQLRGHMQEAGHADEAFEQLDTDRDGKVTLEDFLCAHEKLPLCKNEVQYVLEGVSNERGDDSAIKFPNETHSGTIWRCFRDKLSSDCPELIGDFDELLQEVMNDNELQETTFRKHKEENREQLQQLGELFDEQISQSEKQLQDQAVQAAKQRQLQSVLNHKKDEVLSLKQKVESLEAQVRSHEETCGHVETKLQLAEEQLHEVTKLTQHDNDTDTHCDDKSSSPNDSIQSSPVKSKTSLSPPHKHESSTSVFSPDESTATPPHKDTSVFTPESGKESTAAPPHKDTSVFSPDESTATPPNRPGGVPLSKEMSSSTPVEEGQLLDSSPGAPNHIFKILLLGDQSVGKTAILNRLCNNSFGLPYRATIGVEFRSKYMLLDDKVIALKLWDTAGQERFKSITRSYIRGTNGLLMVYDITNCDSFRSVSGWISSAMDCADKSLQQIMLLGNKVDMATMRAVSHDAVVQLARQYKCEHFEVSAKTGDNVLSSLITMVKRMVAVATEQDPVSNVIHLHSHAPLHEHNRKCCLSHV